MKKIFLLPFCISCFCSITACSSQMPNKDNVYVIEDDVSTIDVTTKPESRCGVNGISCNETALVNYTKTEADYREYGERTKRDHLYTQDAAGNNLTASIRPSIEDDTVVAVAKIQEPITPAASVVPVASAAVGTSEVSEVSEAPIAPATEEKNDDYFENAAPAEIAISPKDYEAPSIQPESVGLANNLKSAYTYEVVCEEENCVSPSSTTVICKDENCVTSTNVVCEDECEDILNEDNDIITSEFTESSFDIADYIQSEDDADDIAFTDIGSKEKIIEDISINEVKITDNTILTWEAEEGDNLRDLLTKWSKASGWKLLWQTNRNYILSAGVMFKGKFTDVSSALIRAFARARPAPIATYYKGNRVIVVETMENENAY